MKSFILRFLGQRASASSWNNEKLIREELFSIDRLEQHAKSLAIAQQVVTRPATGQSLVNRLKDNGSVLLDAYREIATAIDKGRAITPAAEWLLDNYHIVEEQIREIHDDLPPGYYRQLPKLADGHFEGYPRVFGIAWAFVAHTDSLFDPEMLCRFIRAYQEIQPLTIGELWAIAITLRIVLVENLRRAAVLIIKSRAERQQADGIADRLLSVNGQKADSSVDLIFQRYTQSPLPTAFAVQLVQRLRDQDPKVTPALRWLEEHFAAHGTTADQIVRDEHQKQGAANVTVRNIITSMRLISNLDWADLFESISLVDDLLRATSNFVNMDFPTRNLYRSAIEELSRGSKLTELEIARYALVAASTPKRSSKILVEESVDVRREHDPGYYLIAGGRAAFETRIGFKATIPKRIRCFISSLGIGGYIAIVVITTAIVLSVPLVLLAGTKISAKWLWLLAVLGIIPSMDAAIALVNRAITGGFNATILPSLELKDGIPSHLRTMVAVPTLLASPAAIEEQIGQIEIHHLASPESDLHFALLSDWRDADTETTAEDDALLKFATDGIALLNQRYGQVHGGDRFILLHRRRIWNESQQKWMGWERKRGKLHELNQWLRGATDTTFIALDGQLPITPSDIRYVITLDGDTKLPLETSWRLIGKIAHPLNQPRFDEVTGRVVEGYAVLQPRVTASLPMSHEGSLFQQIFSRSSGLDPYSAAVSDVYQDLFGEGSYAGKGIYEVDVFEKALGHRVPENTLLSHDLFEGIFARAGLVSDVEVMEEFPSRYDVHAARQHRWARGDWQLLPWILGSKPSQPGAADHHESAPPLIGTWKMLDNLRRTFSAPAAVFALLAGWTLPFHVALLWTGFILCVIALPTLIPVVSGILPRHARVTTGSHWRALGLDLWIAVSQTMLLITFLAHQAWLMGDAIARTLFRLFISHRYLLEWVTAAQMKVSPRLDLSGFYGQMSGAVLIAMIATLIGLRAGNENWLLMAPFVLIWLISPAVARWASMSPMVADHLLISATDTHALRQIARRTWRFFETFVTVEDNMLPPDNFQEDPKPVVAHRTSPTNMGLYLLSAVSARDLGWAGMEETVDRLEATLATMMKLQRFRGHFYNWYDTQDLRPLDPPYISSVDSGNLAGHLIALANACREWTGSHSSSGDSNILPNSQLWQGIEDNLNLTREALKSLPDTRRAQTITLHELENTLEALGVTIRQESSLNQEMDIAARLMQLMPHAKNMADIARTLASERGDDAGAEMLFWAEATRKSIESHLKDATQTPADLRLLKQRLTAVEATSQTMADAMAFRFLLDPNRKLLSIGYLVNEDRLDQSCYDLLASEARLASFVAIAKGDVPTRHWFRLGRSVTPIKRGAALISWSGSMFEYLMPSLVMRAPTGSLIEQTNRLVVYRQMQYGASRGVPWGISESAYNTRDLELTYQYSNFGVPGLGLKRGLRDNIVIAPYATALATMINPAAAARNFDRLAAIKALGCYGFYEALDYTRSRLPKGKEVAIIRAFMAHHQGMTIVAIANALLNGVMRARFHAEPIVQAAELLLQERTPRDIAVAHPRAEEVSALTKVSDLALPMIRRLHSPHTSTPATHLLSNGRYMVMLTGAGSGYSQWNHLGVTRWREDVTQDDWGSYIFLRDLQSGDVWSAGYQPTGIEPHRYEVVFSEDRAEFIRRDGMITTTLEVIVSPEDDAEVRRVSISNLDNRARTIEITSYTELVLGPSSADRAHPAFSKLFVQTEYLPKVGTILATRRRRAPGEPEVWAAHLAVVEGEVVGDSEIETDRARFLGRGRELRTPIAIMDGRPLSNTTGTVLDPIFSLRQRVLIPPGETVRIAYWTVIASSRNDVLDLVDKHHDANAFERASTLAWTQAQVQLHHLNIDADEACLFQSLGGHILYTNPLMRPGSETLRRGADGPSALWAQSISGDIPIVLVRIDDIENIAIVRQLLRAHEYLRMKQLAFDLVILNERTASYVQDLQITLETMIRTSQSRPSIGEDGASRSVFALRTDLISTETRDLLSSVARVVLDARRGTLSEQLSRTQVAKSISLRPAKRVSLTEVSKALPVRPNLEFFNGLGGFDADGKEYVTILGPGQSPPAPWINIIANPVFGFQVAVEGSGYSWSLNSRENQLTPWSNDPVIDRPGEVIYIRDEDTGKLWGPTALPIRDESSSYIVRHGQGYSRFEHTSHEIKLDLLQYVPLEDPIKISRLKIKNMSDRIRRLSMTAYVEWVLGQSRSVSAPYVITELDPETGALFAQNPWNAAFKGRVAFMDLSGRQTSWTGDRQEFIGRNGTLNSPAGLLRRTPPSKHLGAGLDPCGVLQAPIELKPNEMVEIVFFLGESANATEAQALIAKYRTTDLDAVFQAVGRHWDNVLGTIQVKTPDRSMDIMLNRWMLYQTLVCRVWARSAFYQASGAYGFRDQLQDGMALAVSRPGITREHLLRAAARQFVEGDFQHWWLPAAGQGVRTRISDDRIWLAYATAHYVETTGDLTVLDEQIPFLEGQTLQPGEHDAFFQPRITDECASLFEHCAFGLDQSLRLGAHGLPFIGTGDWNDGMNRVGELGQGESVWLGWFLHTTLSAFIPLAKARKERARAAAWLKHAHKLRASLEQEGWDGDWYRRGYFDDGTPLGSVSSDECQIDSIAQSWSVISGAADPARAQHAMAAVEKHLIRNQDGLALLFTPPFSQTTLDPGYVKSYPAGIRENGGQYTHAATWSVIAFAALGQGDKAAGLFSLLNPINHTSTRADAYRYKVEPYVVAADVYSVSPHVGRGGWTWYTGAAGWMYRAGIEAILGLRLQGASLILNPCIPKQWPHYEMSFRYQDTSYEILVENPHGISQGIASATLDGQSLLASPVKIPLCNDSLIHKVHLTLGEVEETRQKEN
ncbi:MAG TPA: glucoamylase family protein [Coleofasciculaceae cyanobacterium]